MPIRGRKPAGQGVSNNRHTPVHRWTEVDSTPFTGAPSLPRRRAGGDPWTPALRQRWVAWSTMPHCRLWQASDWEFALDTLEIAARFYATSAATWSTELRYREKVMGTTHDSRTGMRIRYVEPAAPPHSPVANIDDYRNL